jgi:hypothetical protein
MTRALESNRVVVREPRAVWAGTGSSAMAFVGYRLSFLTGLLSLSVNYRRSYRKVGAFVFPLGSMFTADNPVTFTQRCHCQRQSRH